MKNKAISAILEHLCNEARNSVHATFSVMELVRDIVADPTVRASVAIGKASADQLLRSLDDARDLFSNAAPLDVVLEQFDLVASLSEIVEMLNVASGGRSKRLLLDGSFDPLPMTQDRRSLEQVLTCVLDTVFKMTRSGMVRVKLGSSRPEYNAQIAIAVRDTSVALRLVKWLRVRLEHAEFEDPEELPFEVAIMVAGKRLRLLDGSVELVRDVAGHAAVVLTVPAQARSVTGQDAVLDPQTLGALNILVAEDNDDSFVLSELVLDREHVSRARDGREALRMVQKQRFDLVFMDVHMPGMDGYEAIRGMREWETKTGSARTPIVILSSDDVDTQRRSAAQCGCSGFVRKPLQEGDLTSLFDRLRQARARTA